MDFIKALAAIIVFLGIVVYFLILGVSSPSNSDFLPSLLVAVISFGLGYTFHSVTSKSK